MKTFLVTLLFLICTLHLIGQESLQISPERSGLHGRGFNGGKRYWISPASVRSDFWDMFKPGTAWDTLLSRIHVFSIHVNALTERTDTTLLLSAVRKLKDARVLVNYECGGLRPFSGCDSLAGERHAQGELVQLLRWYSRGGPIDFITMDSPINTMIAGGDPNGTCNWSVQRAANEMVDYMKEIRRVLPAVRFALVEPIPWYRVGSLPNYPGNNYGDLLMTLDTVLAVVSSRGETLEIFHSDSPYEYSDDPPTQGWKKIKAVEEFLHSKGLRHGRIHNSQLGGFQSDQMFYERTLASWYRYKDTGGDPDEIEVWSWYDHPSRNVPESQPYTFTYACKKFFEEIERAAARVPAKLEPPNGKVYHGVGQSNRWVNEYIAGLADSTIHPVVYNFYYDIPGTRGDKFEQLRQALTAERDIGRIPHLSIAFTDGRVWTDSIIATGNRYDYIIDSIAAACKEYGRRIFIRPGFEFNGSWNPYHPYLYPLAFRKIVDRFRAFGAADSAAFLWCYYPSAPNDFDSIDTRGARWYPGDSYVDWFSLDLFYVRDFHPDSAGYRRGQLSTKGKSERFLALAREKGKPVFLSELSAAGTFVTTDFNDGMNDWNLWFVPFWRFLDEHPEVKGFNYINWDWTQFGQWKEWGDARIEVNPFIRMKYAEELRKPRFIHLRGAKTTGIESFVVPPSAFKLFQNYPNPFNGSTTIGFEVATAGSVRLIVFDVLGRKVATLLDEEWSPGRHLVSFDADGLPSGIYFYRMTVSNQAQRRAMVLIR